MAWLSQRRPRVGIVKSKYPVAMNSLGEMICLGCGGPFPPSRGSRAEVYCSHTCGDRVASRGGRLYRVNVRHAIEDMEATFVRKCQSWQYLQDSGFAK